MKATIKSLQEEVKQLEKKLSKIPEIKVCSECGSVKPLKEFTHVSYSYGICAPPVERDYCKSCTEDVNTRDEAVNIAKNHSKKVVTWWSKGK